LVLNWHEGWLGARPRTALIHQSGLWTVRLLLLSLAITPGRAVLGWARLLLVRRMLGVATAGYALAHLGLYAMQQDFHLLHVGSEIIHRIYLLIGLAALLGLASLAVTSTDAMIRRLGRGWKRLHRWVYGIGVLGLLHFFMQSKSDVTQAVIMAGLFAWLMLWRAAPARWRAQPWFLLLLVPAAVVATAGIEAGWYGGELVVQLGVRATTLGLGGYGGPVGCGTRRRPSGPWPPLAQPIASSAIRHSTSPAASTR
jgi:sulfoxide reductase heme-binding subunit YedZ